MVKVSNSRHNSAKWPQSDITPWTLTLAEILSEHFDFHALAIFYL